MENYATLLKTLGHVDRLRIVALLSRAELTVTELVQILELSQPRVTQYIKSLEDIDVIERLREGSWVFSRLKRTNRPASRIVSAALQALPEDDAVLASDTQKLNEIKRSRSEVVEAFFASVAKNQGQLGNEYLPQARIEQALLEVCAGNNFELMIDMGTGTGRMLEVFSPIIKSGIGLDANPAMLKVARHRLASDDYNHVTVQQCNLNETPFRDGSADLITLHQVLHYLDDPQDAIDEASRLLKAKGVLFIVDFETHENERFRVDYEHRRLGFSENDMAEYARVSNMSIERVKEFENEANPNIIIWQARKNKKPAVACRSVESEAL